MMLDLHGPEYITEVVLIVVCVCCVLCVQRHCTLYTRPLQHSLNDDHARYTTWRSLFSMVLFVAEKSPQNAPSTREVSVFLTDPTPKSAKISGLKNFHICTGSVFFNIILTSTYYSN